MTLRRRFLLWRLRRMQIRHSRAIAKSNVYAGVVADATKVSEYVIDKLAHWQAEIAETHAKVEELSVRAQIDMQEELPQ